MRKKFGAVLVAGLMSGGVIVAGGSPVAADEPSPITTMPHMGEYEEPSPELPAWQQRRLDRANRWLEWADQQIASGSPAKAFQGYRRAVLEVRGFDAGEEIIRFAAFNAFFVALIQVDVADEFADSGRDDHLLNQAEKLLDGCEQALESGGILLGIEKCRRAFLRVSSIVPADFFEDGVMLS